jgi:hypothetical protein
MFNLFLLFIELVLVEGYEQFKWPKQVIDNGSLENHADVDDEVTEPSVSGHVLCDSIASSVDGSRDVNNSICHEAGCWRQ